MPPSKFIFPLNDVFDVMLAHGNFYSENDINRIILFWKLYQSYPDHFPKPFFTCEYHSTNVLIQWHDIYGFSLEFFYPFDATNTQAEFDNFQSPHSPKILFALSDSNSFYGMWDRVAKELKLPKTD